MNIKAEITIPHNDVVAAIERYITSKIGMGTHFKISLLSQEPGGTKEWIAVGTLEKYSQSYTDR